MSDQEIRKIVDQTKMGAAAVGVCIAQILAESDPTLPERLNNRAHLMYRHLCDVGMEHAAEIVFSFGRALVDPDLFPILNPSKDEPI